MSFVRLILLTQRYHYKLLRTLKNSICKTFFQKKNLPNFPRDLSRQFKGGFFFFFFSPTVFFLCRERGRGAGGRMAEKTIDQTRELPVKRELPSPKDAEMTTPVKVKLPCRLLRLARLAYKISIFKDLKPSVFLGQYAEGTRRA